MNLQGRSRPATIKFFAAKNILLHSIMTTFYLAPVRKQHPPEILIWKLGQLFLSALAPLRILLVVLHIDPLMHLASFGLWNYARFRVFEYRLKARHCTAEARATLLEAMLDKYEALYDFGEVLSKEDTDEEFMGIEWFFRYLPETLLGANQSSVRALILYLDRELVVTEMKITLANRPAAPAQLALP